MNAIGALRISFVSIVNYRVFRYFFVKKGFQKQRNFANLI